MAIPFLGELRIFTFGYPPKGWAACDGKLMPINQNQALFSVFGTAYGGDGRTTFGLPNLKGRVPIHMGSGYSIGQAQGEAAHSLTIGEMPSHTHTLTAANDSATQSSGGYLATPSSGVGPIYSSGTASFDTNISSASIANAGNSLPHNNMQPYLVLNFCVAIVGIFPSRN